MAPCPQSLHYSFSAQIETVEVVDKVRSGEGVLAQGLDTVLAHTGSMVGQGQHAVYAIRVTKDGEEIIIKKRFSEFAALHAELLKSFGTVLPFDLPDKGYVRYFSDAALQDRKQTLNAYLKALCGHGNISQHASVLAFLGISPLGTLEPRQTDARQCSHVSEPSVPLQNTMPDDPFELFGNCNQVSNPSVTLQNAKPNGSSEAFENSAATEAPFKAEITGFDVVGGGSTGNGQGSFFPGLGALVQSAGNLVGQGQHAVYTVRVTRDGKVTTVQKRFSDFDKLHIQVTTAFPAGVPFDLPEKTTVNSLNSDFLKGRARALNAYMKALCNSGRPAQYSAVLSFFGLDKPSAKDYPQDDEQWI